MDELAFHNLYSKFYFLFFQPSCAAASAIFEVGLRRLDEKTGVVSTVEGVDLLLAVIDDSLSIEDIDADIFSLLNDNLPLFVNHLMRTPSRSDSDEIMRALQVIVRLI